MKILFAHEILDYPKNNNYNIFYLDYDFFQKINNLLESMDYFSCNIANLFQIILHKRYNIDINKIIIIDFEFFQMKEPFQKIFPNFEYIDPKINNTEISFMDINPGEKIIFNDIFNKQIDNVYCIQYNDENIDNLCNKFTQLNCSFKFLFSNNDDFLYNQNECIKDAKKYNYNNIIIFDFKKDMDFDKDIVKLMIVNPKIKIPNNFNICHLSYNVDTTGKSYRYDKYVLSISKIKSTFGLILNNSSYDILLNNYNNSKDNIYSNLKSYGIYPIICKSKDYVDNSRIFYSLSKTTFQTLMVNLDRRKDRMAKFYKDYGDVYPNIIRFPAIDGKNYDFTKDMKLFDLKDYPLKQKNPYGNHCWKAGTLGCALSHFNIWNKYRHIPQYKDDDFILILEDDIELCDDFNIKLNDLIDDLHKDENWSVCFLGFTDYKDFGDIKISDKLIRFSDNMRKNGGGTFGYLLRKKGAMKLVQLALKYKIQQAVDFFMIEQFDEIVCYKAQPELVFSAMANNGGDSDVQNLNQKI